LIPQTVQLVQLLTPEGNYRLFACGTNATPITDLVGNKLNNGASDTYFTFMIDPTPGWPLAKSSVPADGAVLTSEPTELTVTFNEDVKNDGSGGAANTLANYLLLEAAGDGGFETAGCNGAGVAGTDTEIPIITAVYDRASFTSTLTVSPALPIGSYRLYVCGTTSIEDLAGNKLNDGLSDAQVNFIVQAPGVLPATGFAPGVVTQLPKQGSSEAYQENGYLSLEIPALGVEASIVGVPVSADGWNLSWLGDQAGWLHGTAFPSWAGNSAITAHVYDANGQPGLFNNLGGLKWGDEVIVHAYGKAYVYEVRTVKNYVRPDDTSSVYEHEEYPWLTLITCKGYNEDSDSYRWRVTVRAVQVDVR